MAVLAAVNYIDRLVLLEDGRELPITQFYAACHQHDGQGRLTANSELRSCCRVPDHEDAEVFVVDVPGANASLIFATDAVQTVQPRNIN